MIFLTVLPKIYLWPHYSGVPGARGLGSLNRLNSRFLRHWSEGWWNVSVNPF